MSGKGNIVRNWIEKAEIDIKTAEILLENKNAPTEAICFHAQQAVEKLLKAYLTFVDIKAGKTHDIATLIELCLENDRDFEKLEREKLEEFTFYAVEIRYPDTIYTPSWKEAKESLEIVKVLKTFIFEKLKECLK